MPVPVPEKDFRARARAWVRARATFEHVCRISRGFMDFDSLTSEQIQEWARIVEPDDLLLHASDLSKSQIKAAISAVNESGDSSEWAAKTRALIEGLTDHARLEAAGSALTATQALYLILEHAVWGNSHRFKLSDLLVGIRHQVFFEMLREASTAHVNILKNEATEEPLQHQLTMIHNEILVQSKDIEKVIELLEEEIAFLSVSEMGGNDRKSVETQFELLNEKCQNLLSVIQKALIIAWNSARTDLIEKLSLDKEHLQKFANDTIGQPGTESARPTGIYQLLEWKLLSIYGDPADPVQALSEDTPILEALAQIGVRHPQDFFELGLLPSIKNASQISHEDPHNLIQEAEKNLQRKGFTTLRDLKKAGIFSKKSFIEYLQS